MHVFELKHFDPKEQENCKTVLSIKETVKNSDIYIKTKTAVLT